MKDLVSPLGKEMGLAQTCDRLYFWAKAQRAPTVGAVQITCADESEKECMQAFSRSFADPLLPNLKFGEGSPFRLENLGGRYEWGGVGIAEHHYATEASDHAFKVMVVKINSHVAVHKTAAGAEYGHKPRYGRDSVYCGALHALAQGSTLPAIEELREAFTSEGVDRVALLAERDGRHRALFAAVAQARLQARRVVMDIQDMALHSPTLFLVLPCVTMNRDTDDTEIVCGVYRADLRGAERVVEYQGLGDDPSRYELKEDERPLRIVDGEIEEMRPARDHRAAVVERWAQTGRGAFCRLVHEKGEGVKKVAHERRLEKHADLRYATTMLKVLAGALAGLDPVAAAVLLFGEGLVGIHHAFRMHRLAHGAEADEETRKVLEEVQAKIETLPPGQAKVVVEHLLAVCEAR